MKPNSHSFVRMAALCAAFFACGCSKSNAEPNSPDPPRQTSSSFSRTAVVAESDETKLEKQVAPWTDADTEELWAFICENAKRTSTSPRFAEADETKGESILETFGTQYLPNAYVHYQEVRATAKEREQSLKENFPDGRPSDPAGGERYDEFCKVTTKAVAEMFRRHDELCHYLLLHRMGVVSERELAALDATRISVVLPYQYDDPGGCNLTAPVLAPDEIDFASKYLPESYAAFLRLDDAFSEGVKTFEEWRETALLVDATRSYPLFYALWYRLRVFQESMNGIVQSVKEQKQLHAASEATATALAEVDKEVGVSVRQLEKELAVGPLVGNYVREKVVEHVKQLSPAFIVKKLVENMVKIPGRPFLMGKYEVTRAQWETVMGRDPLQVENPDNPVDGVSMRECGEFLRKLNALPAAKASGLIFRLPTEKEWEYACCAGATGNYCRLADGTEITGETLGEVAWFAGNSDKKTHPVGQKKPNAFGLYDMHGNVEEWTDTAEVIQLWVRDWEEDRLCRFRDGFAVHGGACDTWSCGASHRTINSDSHTNRGFRLCASGKAD